MPTCRLTNVVCFVCCQQNQEFFKADPNTDTWKAYVDYVDEMIVDGFFNTIHCSLQYMLNNTDTKLSPTPLSEARLELQVTFKFHHFQSYNTLRRWSAAADMAG